MGSSFVKLFYPSHNACKVCVANVNVIALDNDAWFVKRSSDVLYMYVNQYDTMHISELYVLFEKSQIICMVLLSG